MVRLTDRALHDPNGLSWPYNLKSNTLIFNSLIFVYNVQTYYLIFEIIRAREQHSLQECVCAQRRLRSDCADSILWVVCDLRRLQTGIDESDQPSRDAQDDMSLRWPHMTSCKKICALAQL